MSPPCLDCSDEARPMQSTPESPLCWLAADLEQRDYLVIVNDTALAEIENLASFVVDNPLPLLQRRLHEFEIPACRDLMRRMKSILDDGVGFAVLERLPMEAYPSDVMLVVFWLLGQCIGRPVAQKWNGQMIYDVVDTGADYAYGTRGSHTAVELNFHTDNAFARMPPDYVGLLCRNPAKSGGVSRFCSLYSVHQRLRDHYPAALERLYRPMLYDRQKEHRDGAEPVCLAPFFSWRDGRLFARANVSLIRKGYEVAGTSMDAPLAAALAAVDEVCGAADLWYEAPLRRGQVQYLNNREIGHYRSAFEDFDQTDKKRHLYRLWHRERGGSSYDGQQPNQV